MDNKTTIFTIGHSTYSMDSFITILEAFKIETLIDIRRYPGSKRYPHFNKDSMYRKLMENGIACHHLEVLGGRRRPKPDSKNTAWRNESFRGYADYMETVEFRCGIEQLTNFASSKNTVYMCSEAVWWSCHRSLVSDYLKVRGWKVIHIMNLQKMVEHPYTSAAKVGEGQILIDYSGS